MLKHLEHVPSRVVQRMGRAPRPLALFLVDGAPRLIWVDTEPGRNAVRKRRGELMGLYSSAPTEARVRADIEAYLSGRRL